MLKQAICVNKKLASINLACYQRKWGGTVILFECLTVVLLHYTYCLMPLLQSEFTISPTDFMSLDTLDLHWHSRKFLKCTVVIFLLQIIWTIVILCYNYVVSSNKNSINENEK